MLELPSIHQPKGQWLSELSAAWDRVLPLATEAVTAHGAYKSDNIAETIAAWLGAHPQAVADAAVLLSLQQADGARAALDASLAVFFKLAPEWQQTLRTPTRMQAYKQWNATGVYDGNLAETLDGMRSSELRACVRKHLREGRPLPPRSDDDNGAPCSRRHRVARVTTVERAGISIDTIEAEAHIEETSGAMPSPRQAQRVQIGNRPHPRFPSIPTESQER